MKRVMVVASYFYPKIGGLENYAFLLAKKLEELGDYSVHVVTSNYDGKGYRRDVIDGITIHRLPTWFRISNTPIGLTWYWWVRRIIAIEKPDLIHLHSPVPYLADIAAFAAGDIPVVLTYHAGSMRKGSMPIDLIVGTYEDVFLPLLFKKAAAVVTISQKFARKKFPEFVSKMYFIPTGVDLNRFTPTPLPEEHETITFVGRIEYSSSWKGIEQLLQAMVLVLKKRPKVQLEIVGGGDAVDHYRNRAQKLGIAQSVSFPGPQLGDDLVGAYGRSSVVVLPSTSDAEAFSIVLVEAMASGRPIIGTNIGGTPQVIEHGKNGLLVTPNDPRSLAEAILEILTNRKLAENFVMYGSQKARGFSWTIQAAKYIQLFQQVLESTTK